MRIRTEDGKGHVVEDVEVPDAPDIVNQRTIEDRLDAAVAGLTAFVNGTGTMTAAQQRQLVRVVLGLVKLERRSLSSTDGT